MWGDSLEECPHPTTERGDQCMRLLRSILAITPLASISSAAKHPYARVMSTGPPHPKSGLFFLTVGTPNGLKVSLALEELKAAGSPVKWEEYKVDFGKNEQKEPWFLDINPNGRIPALVDIDRGGVKVWETGSILLYLGKHYDQQHLLHFDDDDLETEMLNWVFFQHGGLGPMQGQAGHFLNAAPEKIPYAARRYIDETKRLFAVYEDRLKDRDYLVGPGKGKYSFADIVAMPWVRAVPFSLGIPTVEEAGFPRLAEWVKRIEQRDAGKVVFADDMITQMKNKPDFVEKTRERVKFLSSGDKDTKAKDEL